MSLATEQPGAGPVTFEMRGPVALLTLNDPARRNALSRALVGGLIGGVERSRREGARAVVIAANGPAFCAGANIDDLRNGWMEGASPDTDPVRLFRRLAEHDRVVIAAVHGAAVGGGFELTLACDLVVVEPGAFFALPELGHGVIPNTALDRLSRIVGSRRALDLILTRRRVGAEEAAALGLATRSVGTGEAVSYAVELAMMIVSHVPPGALGVAKATFNRHHESDWPAIAASLGEVPAGEWREGLDAFTERRRPDYERFWREAAELGGSDRGSPA